MHLLAGTTLPDTLTWTGNPRATMLGRELAELYVGDLRKLTDEIGLFRNEEDLWKTAGSIANPAGTLVSHIAGGLNHFVGHVLAHTNYTRNRDVEFSRRDVRRDQMVDDLEQLTILVQDTLSVLDAEQLAKQFPVFFDRPGTSTSYVLTQLLLHLNYHLGQVNYLRRMLSQLETPTPVLSSQIHE